MTDYISREEAVMPFDLGKEEWTDFEVAQEIRSLAAADVRENVHAHWIDKPLDKFRKFESKCSACGWSGVSNYDSYVDIFDFKFCPNCGAIMDEETEL